VPDKYLEVLELPTAMHVSLVGHATLLRTVE
jgi:hypothetical protein